MFVVVYKILKYKYGIELLQGIGVKDYFNLVRFLFSLFLYDITLLIVKVYL